MEVVSSFLPFPAISWWANIINADKLLLDGYEHFEKMTYRNKFRISGANNPIQLSVPVTGGREQRKAMRDVAIHNQEKWQIQHWRTLVSVYRQSPFWEYYEPSLEVLYGNQYTLLTDFNKASILWCIKQLKLAIPVNDSVSYQSAYNGATDLRQLKPAKKEALANFPKYYQVFEDRIGFQPDLSILDLLFSEGPNTLNWMKERSPLLMNAEIMPI